MSPDLIQMSNALTPYTQADGLVATVNNEIASTITTNKERIKHDSDPFGSYGNPTRVSELFMSRYGIMGYVEYSISTMKPWWR